MNPGINEAEIRKYLTENISEIDKGNSILLFGVDFEKDSMDIIIERIYSLYNEVKQLGSMIAREFKSENDAKVLMPSSIQVQQDIEDDYMQKKSVLLKVLECPGVKDLLTSYVNSLNNGSLNKR